MAHNKPPSFDVEINESTLLSAPIPRRIFKLVRGKSKVYVRRGSEIKVFPIYFICISYGHRVETHLGGGWRTFLEENDIRLEDKLEITYEGHKSFHVRVFRGGIEIPYAVDPSTGDRSSSRISNHGDGPGEEEAPPQFSATFTQPYINVGRLNVPLHFARAHFNSFGPETPVHVSMTNQYHACLYIKRNSRDQITLCNIRNGISDLIRGENIKRGDEVVVQMISTDPPHFKVLWS